VTGTRDDIVALVPAAGSGSRMGADTPKQYLSLQGETIISHTLKRLHSVRAITQVVVMVPAEDVGRCSTEFPTASVTAGGDTRAASVANGLEYCRTQLNHEGFVLVHDAARPCVRVADINHLIEQVGHSEHGGILATPVHDTLKRADNDQCIEATVTRERMWRAVTPQMFPAPLLAAALQSAAEKDLPVTDEASAMELAGYKPQLVAGSQDNLKITVADDLSLADTILTAQENS